MGGVSPTPLIDELLAEILRDAYRYVPGIEPTRPTITSPPAATGRRLGRITREHVRDLIERAAARAGFARRHFPPEITAERLRDLLALADELEQTFAALDDWPSRNALRDLLKLRVLGPYHARLAITPELFRARQATADRDLRVQAETFDVSDPWFTPLSLYRIPAGGGGAITLHSHSVDIVSVFLLEQYRYRAGSRRVEVQPGDVVLDIGGCWGDTALYFADRVGSRGKVYTFEFDPESLCVLRANLELNPELARRIEVVEMALWDRPETVAYVPAGRMTSVASGSAGEAAPQIPATTLDAFVADAAIDRLDFVKMDVEGAEVGVLTGGRATVRSRLPRLAIAAYHHEDDLVRIPQTLGSVTADYRLYLRTASPVQEETVLFAAPQKAGEAVGRATDASISA